MKIKFFSLLIILSFILAACGERTEEGILFRTADPKLSIGIRIPQAVDAPALPTVTPAVVPEVVVPEDEVGVEEPVPLPDPCEKLIKGNVSSNGEKIAHSPGQSNYETVKIDEEAGERFFCSLEEAEAEGWRAARN